MSSKTITIIIEDGEVSNVHGIPDDWSYETIDLDWCGTCECHPDERKPIEAGETCGRSVCLNCNCEILEDEDD